MLFNSLGSGRKASLLNTVIIGAVNVIATFVAILTADKVGRKMLLIEGGVQMILAMVITSVVLGVEFGTYNTGDLPSSVAVGVLVVICVFVAGFAWSLGPLGWLIPSEIQPLETRAAGKLACNWESNIDIGCLSVRARLLDSRQMLGYIGCHKNIFIDY